ncbi:MAG: lmo0937 family membrane protein [Minisyncoccota bacterium]
MLETLIVILLVLWLLGFSFHVGGGLIHALLIIALIIFIVRLLS